MALDVSRVRKDFPILDRVINGKRLVYLDSAATSQKPRAVIDAMTQFQEHSYAPTHRSAYQLATESTEAYETARHKVRRFVHGRADEEIVFTKNATEALNLVVRSWGGANLGPGDVLAVAGKGHEQGQTIGTTVRPFDDASVIRELVGQS